MHHSLSYQINLANKLNVSRFTLQHTPNKEQHQQFQTAMRFEILHRELILVNVKS